MIEPHQTYPNGLNTEPVVDSDNRDAESTVNDVAEKCGAPVADPDKDHDSLKTSVPPASVTPRLGDLIGWEQVKKLSEQRARSRARAAEFRTVRAAAGRLALSQRSLRARRP